MFNDEECTTEFCPSVHKSWCNLCYATPVLPEEMTVDELDAEL